MAYRSYYNPGVTFGYEMSGYASDDSSSSPNEGIAIGLDNCAAYTEDQSSETSDHTNQTESLIINPPESCAGYREDLSDKSAQEIEEIALLLVDNCGYKEDESFDSLDKENGESTKEIDNELENSGYNEDISSESIEQVEESAKNNELANCASYKEDISQEIVEQANEESNTLLNEESDLDNCVGYKEEMSEKSSESVKGEKSNYGKSAYAEDLEDIENILQSSNYSEDKEEKEHKSADTKTPRVLIEKLDCESSESDEVPIYNSNQNAKNKDWNGEFQTILDLPDDKKEKWEKLYQLGKDFVYSAKTYGKIIISEIHLGSNEKTIKPIDAGGIAGGAKYLCHSIFFKLVRDNVIATDANQQLWMYGGSKRDDYAAIKAAGHEIRALTNFFNRTTKGVHYPLMALIDYHGYRLIAMSILPVSRGTIIYGSADGGHTIFAKNPNFNEKMSRIGNRMNLMPHIVYDKSIAICGDIEGHLGTDNKFYVLDFARTFPPEAPSKL